MYRQIGTAFKFVLTNPSSPTDLQIYTCLVNNGIPNTIPGGDPANESDWLFNILVLTYSGGVITYANPTYTY